MLLRKLLPLLSAAALAGCAPSDEPPAKAASSPAAASAPAPASAPAAASAASAAASSLDQPAAAAKLGPQSQAKWQSYRCDEGKAQVRYYQDKDGAAAQIKYKGSTFSATYSPELSEDDLSTFSNGHQSWTIARLADDFYRENDGFLVFHERPDPTSSDVIVDNLVLQNCQPE